MLSEEETVNQINKIRSIRATGIAHLTRANAQTSPLRRRGGTRAVAACGGGAVAAVITYDRRCCGLWARISSTAATVHYDTRMAHKSVGSSTAAVCA